MLLSLFLISIIYYTGEYIMKGDNYENVVFRTFGMYER